MIEDTIISISFSDYRLHWLLFALFEYRLCFVLLGYLFESGYYFRPYNDITSYVCLINEQA